MESTASKLNTDTSVLKKEKVVLTWNEFMKKSEEYLKEIGVLGIDEDINEVVETKDPL